MKQVISYMANDGTVFDDYDDCVQYESIKNREAAKGQLRFYDFAYNVIGDETLSEEEAPQVLLNCYYLFVGNEAAIRLADEMGYLSSCSTPKTTGYWYYNSKEDLWISITKKMTELRNKLITLENTLKNLEVH